MDPVRNPFAPGAGTQPPELAGRTQLIEAVHVALQRLAIRRPTKSVILVGLRGVGKTVLLVKMADISRSLGNRTINIEAREGGKLVDVLIPSLRTELYALSFVDNAKEKARRALRVMKSFLGHLKVSYGGADLSLSIEPEEGSADSGILENDLPNLLVAVGEAALAAGTGMIILIDEIQIISSEEFSALIIGIHKISQLNLPVLLIGAGLPQIPGIAGDSKSYAERLFSYPEVGVLKEEDAVSAITKPVENEGAAITENAVQALMRVTECYPYFLQQWAYDAWNQATNDVITAADVDIATPIAFAALDADFFKTRYQRCNNSERKYMRALADLGPGVQKSADVAARLELRTNSKGPTRDALIKKGMIYSPQHGDICFTVPKFDDYMRRVMPQLII